jgi:hypothetical protein
MVKRSFESGKNVPLNAERGGFSSVVDLAQITPFLKPKKRMQRV